MAEQQKAREQPPAKQPEPPPSARLAPAGASTDPAVQNLIAAREIAERNGDTQMAAGLTARLAELGAA